MQETHPIVITSMNAIHVLEGDEVFRQLNITILELAKRVVSRALITLFVDKYGRRQLLWFLRGHDKNHRAKDGGQHHWQQYVPLVYHHGAKIHFFFDYAPLFFTRAELTYPVVACLRHAVLAHRSHTPHCGLTALVWG